MTRGKLRTSHAYLRGKERHDLGFHGKGDNRETDEMNKGRKSNKETNAERLRKGKNTHQPGKERRAEQPQPPKTKKTALHA